MNTNGQPSGNGARFRLALPCLILLGILVACGGEADPSSSVAQAPDTSSATSPSVTSAPEMLPAAGSEALIYNGPVAAEGGPEAVAAVVRDIGLDVAYVSDLAELPDLLEDAAVFIIGGTEDDLSPLATAFTPEVDTALKRYLRSGGRYLGICGGGWLASSGWDEYGTWIPMLGLVPADSGILDDDEKPRILSIEWLGETYPMYFQYGPTFTVRQTSEDVRVIAHYSDGQIAALISSYGSGKVAVCGAHPEAQQDWAEEAADGEDWTSTTHLLGDLLQNLLSSDPVNP
jgi:hypothetical protein